MILVLTAQTGVERDELLVPLKHFREAGVKAVHAAPEADAVQTFLHDTDKDAVVTADVALSDVNAAEYDAIIIPGGTVNADKLRGNDDAVQLVKNFAEAGKPIASICHGPWILVEANLLRGKKATSYKTLRTDITNAGGEWVDEPVVRSTEGGWTLITSRNPGDLEDFCAAIDEALS
ncbi:type 1 glutamine amidotransferase domain-containing protein [Hoyosella subflava]|nr:type 1 glutamine amidotransferase domain-containing protein [Hoyosella subflava]